MVWSSALHVEVRGSSPAPAHSPIFSVEVFAVRGLIYVAQV